MQLGDDRIIAHPRREGEIAILQAGTGTGLPQIELKAEGGTDDPLLLEPFGNRIGGFSLFHYKLLALPGRPRAVHLSAVVQITAAERQRADQHKHP